MGISRNSSNSRTARSSPALSNASKKHTIFQVFTIPYKFIRFLRSRSGPVNEFYIRLVDPHRQYGSGDVVKGAVILTVVKPICITHLVVSLHGYVRIYKGTNAPTDIPPNPSEHAASSGYITLFHEEVPLSGEGRLEPGRYEFLFDLDIPQGSFPSSIEFEKGTISYVVTATLTLPTSDPNRLPRQHSCACHIQLVKMVDIGFIKAPLPQIISLEPISKRPKKKRPPDPSAESSTTINTAVPGSSSDMLRMSGHVTEAGYDHTHEPHGNNPQNATQSDVRSISDESAATSSTAHSRADVSSLHAPAIGSLGDRRNRSLKERTITATVELLKGGCLPGDTVPVKISVQHNRPIRSMRGVILTLYRLTRIDSSPLSFTRESTDHEGQRTPTEDFFPRFRTGLGVLSSFSSSNPYCLFRKDLAQAFAPLIINPESLKAELVTSVRVPVDAFPTIQDVPHEIISFTYHIEVLVDLGGKLANQIRGGLPSPPAVNTLGGPPGLSDSAATMTAYAANILETDGLRRQKGVISAAFDLVVGTLDSSRNRARNSTRPSPAVSAVPVGSTPRPSQAGVQPSASPHVEPYTPVNRPQAHTPSPIAQLSPQSYPYWNNIPPKPLPEPYPIPPPQLPDESALSEKERMRLAEQRLLPSQPPEVPLARLSHSSHLNPSPNSAYSSDSQPPFSLTFEAPSAPTLDDIAAGSTAQASAVPDGGTEDKQELERRQLLAEVSAPPQFPPDGYGGDGQGATGSLSFSAQRQLEQPTAPPLSMVEGDDHKEPSAPPPELLGEDPQPRDDEALYGRGYSYGEYTSSYLAACLPYQQLSGVQAQGHISSSGQHNGGNEPLPKYEQ